MTKRVYTGNQEWYTPQKYIDAARVVMGEIDLDPASHAYAQAVVQATTWYGLDDDGLSRPWDGRVFLNPPYTYPLIVRFIDKLLAHLWIGDVSEAILLTNNSTDTAWWHNAATVASAVCFTKRRIIFYKADATKMQPTNGQTFFYFGDNASSFSEVFSCFGAIGAFTSKGDGP